MKSLFLPPHASLNQVPESTVVGCLKLVLAGALFGALFHVNDLWANGIKLLCLAACYAALRSAPAVRQGLLFAWAWGAGATLTGMAWLYIAMHNVGGMPMVLAGLGVILLSVLLGAFNGLAGAASVWLHQGQQAWFAMCFTACWVLGEWLRTWVFTGLPWMSVGYGFLDTPAAGVSAGFGVLGVGAVAVLSAMCLANLLNAHALKAMLGGVVVIVACHFAGQTQFTSAQGAPLSVALLQGNVPQTLKFDPTSMVSHMQRYADMAAASTAQLTVMPETALPRPLNSLPESILRSLTNNSQQGTLMVGTIGETHHNGLAQYTNRLDMPYASSVQARNWTYDKSHLVPFGESIPTGFQWVLDTMNIPLTGLGRGDTLQANAVVNGIGIAVNICYEELFAHEWRSRAAAAHLLLNASNFGWYGDSTALPQHVNIARMRAMEFQKPYLSATNNGMTVAVLPTGMIQSQLPKNTEGVLTVTVQGMVGETPYSRWGDWGAVGLAGLILLGFLLRGAKRSR